MKIFKKFETGFTLVELLIGLFILSTIGTLIIGILWISLRSTVKINNMNIIRQHSSFVVLQMTKMLQFAKDFQGVSNDGISFTTNCELPDTLSVTPYSSATPYSYVKITNHDDGITTLACIDADNTIASNSANLFSTEIFSVTECHFTCTQITKGSPYTIGFSFKVQKMTDGNIFDDPASLSFQNSVTIRNSSL